MEEKERIHLKDIIEGTKPRDTKIFTVGDRSWWANRITKDQIATHDDCEKCGKEFEKPYTYSRLCFNCEYIRKNEKYQAMEFKHWDGNTPLVIFDSDTYFFDQDDISNYVDEQNAEAEDVDPENYFPISESDLRLVICEPNHMKSIPFDLWEDSMPVEGDGEIPKEIEDGINALNELIKEQLPLSWSPGKFRTTVSFK